MKNGQTNHDALRARERIAEILRTAMGDPEEDGLEDETRRLMLHLSIDQPEATAAPPEPTVAVSRRTPLLQRLLRRRSDT